MDLAYLAIAFAAAFLAWRNGLYGTLDPATRRAWRIISAAYLVLGMSYAMRAASVTTFNRSSTPSWADLIYLAFYPVMLWGVLSFRAGGSTRAERARFWGAVALVFAGGGLVAWYVALKPDGQANSGQLLQSGTYLAYAAGAMALLFSTGSVMLSRLARGSREALEFFAAGLILYLVTDLGSGASALRDASSPSGWPYILVLLALLLFAAGAQYQHWQANDAESSDSTQNRLAERLILIPYMLVAACFVLLLLQERTTSRPMPEVVIGALALTCMVATRQAAVTRENSRRASEHTTRLTEHRLRSLVQNSGALISVLEPDGTIKYQNPSIEGILNYRVHETIGKSIFDFIHPDDRHTAQLFLLDVASHPEDNRNCELRVRNARGEWRYFEMVGKNQASDPAVAGIVLNCRDITQHKVLEEKLAHQALHEPLTGLPNRALFMDRLQHALAHAVRSRQQVALMFLDLDNFKVINDSLGHKAGDQLLVAVGRRLKTCLRPDDTVAHLGGDEFTLLLEGIHDLSDATVVAERIQRQLRTPFHIEDREVVTSASMGIVLSLGDDTPGDMLRSADIAMYESKHKGRARYTIFDPKMTSRAWERMRLETELRRAIEQGQLEVYYQPIINLRNGTIEEMEALVRWRHPQRGIVTPVEFIPLAEETGLILPLGRWVLAEACRQTSCWHDAGQPLLHVSVNLSAKQLQHPGLLDDIRSALADSSLAPSTLRLEITESMAMEDPDLATGTLRQIKDLGVNLAIDDFGTGYSTLSYLKRLPVDTLKIDKSLVHGVGQMAEDEAIVRAAIAFAKALNLHVTAEGLETAAQLYQLRKQGCDYGQGYYFARPLPANDVTTLLDNRLPGAALTARLSGE